MACAFGYQNSIDNSGVGFTASSEATTLPATNVTDSRIEKSWRALATSGVTLGIDFLTAQTLRQFALIGTNIGAADTWQIKLSASAIGSTDVYDSGVLTASVAEDYELAYHIAAADKSARYMQITINATSRASLGYFDVGRIYAGAAFIPTRNPIYGLTDKWQDNSVITRAPKSGAAYVDIGSRFRRLDFGFDAIPASEKDTFQEIDRQIGMRKQILFTQDTSSGTDKQTIFGYIAEASPLRLPYFQTYEKSYSIEQAR